MRRRLGRIALASVSVVVGAVILAMCAGFAIWVLPCELNPITELTRVDVGNSRSVIFFADTCWEVSRGVFYESQENGQVIIPRTGLGNHSPVDYSFKVATAEAESLVAVYTPGSLDYDAILVMIDFRKQEAWHIGDGKQDKAKGQEMLRRLKQANPDLPEPRNLLP